MLINRLFQREKKWLLICKPTEDGFDVNDFHRLYNNRGTTLTLIQIRNYLHMKKHDSIFDGYTTKPWPSQHGFYHDP
ncbi:unnamed protein product [Rotaria sordida]|uniref:TLDc domain-containing protein n=1 Tax=Rotaria sordida TaxID=392033 RepID=A0A820KHK6_9BILA|nr:unnamed protein product [Rotaria sordida]